MNEELLKEIEALKSELIECYLSIWELNCYPEENGWYSHDYTSDAELASKRLVELGILEKHPSQEWFMAIKKGGDE